MLHDVRHDGTRRCVSEDASLCVNAYYLIIFPIMGLLSGLVPIAPLLAGTLVGTCLIAGGESFIAHSKPTRLHLPLEHQRQHDDDNIMRSSRCCSSREQRPRRLTAVTMLLAPSCSRPPLRAWKTDSSSRSSSSSTALFADGGGWDDPMGPGTQKLSRQAKLAISILIDLIGMSSYALPGVGEVNAVLLG